VWTRCGQNCPEWLSLSDSAQPRLPLPGILDFGQAGAGVLRLLDHVFFEEGVDIGLLEQDLFAEFNERHLPAFRHLVEGPTAYPEIFHNLFSSEEILLGHGRDYT